MVFCQQSMIFFWAIIKFDTSSTKHNILIFNHSLWQNKLFVLTKDKQYQCLLYENYIRNTRSQKNQDEFMHVEEKFIEAGKRYYAYIKARNPKWLPREESE